MNNIKELKENEIFVFGSNTRGRHGGGAAKFAVDNFGAIWGIGYGFQGQSYAIPTLDDSMQKVPLSQLKKDIETFVWIAKHMPSIKFLLTPIGTGIAGFSFEEIESIIPLLPPNVTKIW